MATHTATETNSNNTNDKFQSVVRRKLERFRTKLSELLFTTANDSNSLHTNSNNNQFTSIVHSPPTHQAQALPDDTNSMLISNYYYGYTSPISEEDLRLGYKSNTNKKAKKFHKITSSSSSSSNSSASSNSSSACSSSSSMIIDDDDSNSNLSSYHSQPQNGDFILSQYPVNFDSQFGLPQSLTTGVITLNKTSQIANQQLSSNIDYYSFNSQLNSLHSNYDTSSLNTNEEENPFLNKRLTDQIHFNSDLSVLSNYFESALDLIDDMDNFFNIDFMTNYISYILLKQINDSSLLAQIKWHLKMSPSDDNKNLLKEIAEQIFLESRDEPCGLKGCNISVFVRDQDQTENTTLVSRFQFGTSRFGAFDINLVLKAEEQVDEMAMDSQESAIATLTRRIFSSAKANSNSTHNNANKQYPSDSSKTVYLDSKSYDLFKTNLAYE